MTGEQGVPPTIGDPQQLAAVLQQQRREQEQLAQVVQDQQRTQQIHDRLQYVYALFDLSANQMLNVSKITGLTIDQLLAYSDDELATLLDRIKQAQTPQQNTVEGIASSLLALKESILAKDLKDNIPKYDPSDNHAQQKFMSWIRALRRQRRLHSLSDATMRELVTSSAKGAALDFLSRTLDENR